MFRSVVTVPRLFLLGVVALATGCSSTGFERAEQATASMRGLEDELDRLAERMTLTGETLGDLLDDSEADVKTLYTSLVFGVSQLEGHRGNVERRSKQLRSKGEAYFKAWDENLEKQADEELRSLSESRRARSHREFDGLLGEVGEIDARLAAYLLDLGEIQTYLDTNLNRGGIEAVAGKIEGARSGATAVEEQIQSASEALDAWTLEWAPPVPEPTAEAADEAQDAAPEEKTPAGESEAP